MSRKHWLIVLAVVSLTMWAYVGYRLLAWQTGKLGTVSVFWNGRQVNRYIEWSPSQEVYEFTAAGALQLPPQAKAYFLVDPPPRFRGGTVRVAASGQVNVVGEYRQPASIPTDIAAVRTWSWRTLSRFPGGHRLHIQNVTNQDIFVTKIQLTFVP